MFTWFFTLDLTTQIITGYAIIVNLIAFFFYGIDKMKSMGKHRRISEKTLWTLALIGGSGGALLAMKFFRHKTKKLSFQATLAGILALQIILTYFILTK
ncbi:DUF1294 domain-containing protein [Candidatus Parcubacteria bacterium]|jgi:uncharacterized membrane protein YsdA (DUF1294 family)|nr:DUF1294 domain-containing protein [Candidatus Parcubacteria bacterium]MBT3948829.1 DUF1294 domain-containing protein [Candidatus Parcubacteria bacterium]